MNKNFDDLIKEHGTINPHYVWSKVNTLEELFYCNEEFIKDNLKESFYHYGSFVIDSNPLIEDLLKLHDKGVFTYGGQGSLLEYDKWIETECGKWFCSIEQKPYLTCMIHNKYAKKLIKYFEKFNTENIDDKINYIINGKYIKATNITTEKYNLTKTKTYKELSQKSISKWNYYTNFWLNNEFENSDLLFCINILSPKLYKIFYDDYISLDICASKYGSEIVIEKVLLDFFN